MGGGRGGEGGGRCQRGAMPTPPAPLPTHTLRFISHDPSKCCEEVQKCSLPLELLYFLYFAADEGEFMNHQHLICSQKKNDGARLRSAHSLGPRCLPSSESTAHQFHPWSRFYSARGTNNSNQRLMYESPRRLIIPLVYLKLKSQREERVETMPTFTMATTFFFHTHCVDQLKATIR